MTNKFVKNLILFSRCAFCENCVGDWEVGDIPLEEHGKLFPMCGFIRGLPVGNISIESGRFIRRLPVGNISIESGRFIKGLPVGNISIESGRFIKGLSSIIITTGVYIKNVFFL